MTTLMQANHQWSTRPDDQRFCSLPEMLAHFQHRRAASRASVLSSRRMRALPMPDHKGLVIEADGNGLAGEFAPTHWAFGQLAQLSGAPAGYLRTLPAELVADCVNYGLHYKRDVEDVGLLTYRNGESILRCATGPGYGRIWNDSIVDALVKRFGDGVNGQFRIPAEFGVRAPITTKNTTLYGSDRDMWVFLADEENRIEIPNRRNGQTGTLARGFFMWNSEEGDSTFGIATFLYDYMCGNHIVWGAREYKEIKIRHTAKAPDRFIEEIAPALETYSRSSTASITNAIEAARKARVDNVDDFLAKRFSARMAPSLQAIHKLEEGRPIETLWDVTTAVTALARSVTHTDRRVELERQAGDVMDLATA